MILLLLLTLSESCSGSAELTIASGEQSSLFNEDVRYRTKSAWDKNLRTVVSCKRFLNHFLYFGPIIKLFIINFQHRLLHGVIQQSG